jgi:hypothetical protein
MTTLMKSPMGYQLPFASSDELATAAAAFKEDGRGGRHDTEWLRQAQVAYSLRANGAYDKFLEEKFEEDWAERAREDLTDDGDDDGDLGGDDADDQGGGDAFKETPACDAEKTQDTSTLPNNNNESDRLDTNGTVIQDTSQSLQPLAFRRQIMHHVSDSKMIDLFAPTAMYTLPIIQVGDQLFIKTPNVVTYGVMVVRTSPSYIWNVY